MSQLKFRIKIIKNNISIGGAAPLGPPPVYALALLSAGRGTGQIHRFEPGNNVTQRNVDKLKNEKRKF